MMTYQKTLFDNPPTLAPRDPHIEPRDRTRLAGQNAEILAALRTGDCTNKLLARLSLKYTSRISDLRAAGYRIKCLRLGGGLNLYSLEE